MSGDMLLGMDLSQASAGPAFYISDMPTESDRAFFFPDLCKKLF
jgi:hypothetical protein